MYAAALMMMCDDFELPEFESGIMDMNSVTTAALTIHTLNSEIRYEEY